MSCYWLKVVFVFSVVINLMQYEEYKIVDKRNKSIMELYKENMKENNQVYTQVKAVAEKDLLEQVKKELEVPDPDEKTVSSLLKDNQID